MLEAKLQEAGLLKKLLDAIKELVTDANFDCNEEGLNLQAMDNSHVALVVVKVESTGFKKYRCDRPIPLGVNLNSLTKVLKCAKDDDQCTLKADDGGDLLSLMYEAKSSDRIAEYEMKLMDIDAEQLGIPDTDYDARVTLPSGEFTRIVRDLSLLGESVRIEVNKEGVRFISEGEAANGSILLKPSEGAVKIGDDENEDEDENEDDDDDKPKKKKKSDKKGKKVKKEVSDDVEMDGDDDDEEFKAKSEDEGEEEKDDEDEEDESESSSKKRKKASSSKSKKPSKKARTKKDKDEDDYAGGVKIEMNQGVTLTFSLKYLVNFSKSSSLSDTTQLMMSNDVPLLPFARAPTKQKLLIMFNYVIEHMEEDEPDSQKTIPPWVELEYAHMRMFAGPQAKVRFTHLSESSCKTLQDVFSESSSPSNESSGKAQLANASCHTEGILECMKQFGVPIDKVCLLDPKAEKELSPEDGDGRFEWFLFGGILGDDPPRDRTSELRAMGFPNRHLGSVQMTTDTALGVTKIVVDDKVPLKDIPFIDFPTIVFNPKESVEMPFRYITDDKGNPRLPPGMRELLHEDLNKGFEF
ncbi:hypothetical protein ONZ45_g143 [Pleurotus djamor]|nr:hypothetical protein ONZ45_g143 [Pleurotus djamor]